MSISGIVMASGSSRRMGENKLLLKLGDKKVYQYLLDTLESADLDEIIVVSIYPEILDKAKKKGFIPINNNNPTAGKSQSIIQGIKAAKNYNNYMFFVADQPFISLDTINSLIKTSLEKDLISFPTFNDKRGNPVIFPNRFRDDLLRVKKDQGGMMLVNTDNSVGVEVGNELELMDMDIKSDYEELLRLYE